MRSIIAPVIVLIAVVGGICAWYFSDYQVAKRQVLASLEAISDSANAMAQKALMAQLNNHLTDDATVKMDVSFNVFAQGSKKGWQMEYNKQQFAAFITQMIERSKTYGSRLKMEDLVVGEDGKSVTVKIRAASFSTSDAAMAMIARKVATRFVIKSDCSVTGTVGEMFKIQSMDCPTRITQQADLKSGQMKGALKELKGLKP